MPLPAAMGATIPINPCPLGVRTVAAAGTAVQLCGNFTDLSNRHVHYLEVQALPGNSDNIYVLAASGDPPWTLPDGTAGVTGADTTNYLNVLRVLVPGESWAVPSWRLNLLRLGQFWIDSVDNNDKVISNCQEA